MIPTPKGMPATPSVAVEIFGKKTHLPVVAMTQRYSSNSVARSFTFHTDAEYIMRKQFGGRKFHMNS